MLSEYYIQHLLNQTSLQVAHESIQSRVQGEGSDVPHSYGTFLVISREPYNFRNQEGCQILSWITQDHRNSGSLEFRVYIHDDQVGVSTIQCSMGLLNKGAS